ncbi:MAG: DinB family protein [Armatimonadetes bacterium]|nr:DinB family protein [Armatimonadota bacterium]
METRAALKSQYHAALAMLRQAIERCPDDLWTAGEHPRAFWRIAYHALFYTHLYLQPNHDAFRPWEEHRDDCQFLDAVPWPPHAQPPEVAPYAREQLLAYWRFCDEMIDAGVDRVDLDAPESGFPWYRMPKLDHQMVNIRHIQQHVGQLAERLIPAGADPDWIGSGP